MGTIVAKFGGTSMADAAMFRKVAGIVQKKELPLYIVLSAPGKRAGDDEKITDLLYAAQALYSAGKDCGATLEKVRSRFASIAGGLGITEKAEALLSVLCRERMDSACRAASLGEYLCAGLFALSTGLPFVDAAGLIHFDESGRLMYGQTCRSIREMAARTPVAVIPGFYGSMPDGSVRTFSRGGSDITGALIAAALKAEIYENWSDVDGLMSADPRLCPDARLYGCASYRHMRRLANAGAQLMHPCAIEPVCEAGVPSVLKNTFHPDLPGTYISDHVHVDAPCLCLQRGLRMVRTAALCPEAKAVASGLNAETYRSEAGDCLALAGGTAPGVRVERISLFSGSEPVLRAAKELAQPSAWLMREGCIVLLKEEAEPALLRRLHDILLNGAQGDQNSRSA